MSVGSNYANNKVAQAAGASTRVWHWFTGLLGVSPQDGPDALPVRVHGREFARTAAAPVGIKGFDQPLLWSVVTLLLCGLIMVYSASIAMPDNPHTAHYSQTHYLVSHRWGYNSRNSSSSRCL